MPVVTKQITLEITYNSDEMLDPMKWWWPDLIDGFYQIESIPPGTSGVIRLEQIGLGGE